MLKHSALIENRFTLPPSAQEALRIVAAREGQTQAAFIRSCIMPFLRDEIRVLESLRKKPPTR